MRARLNCQTGSILAMTLLILASPGPAAFSGDFSLRTAFTYEGALDHLGEPAEGLYDFEVELWTDSAGGELLGRINRLDHPVSGGVLTLPLDFGQSVTGQVRWLEIRVRKAGDGPFMTLDPRQRLAGKAVCTVTGDLDVSGDIAARGTKIRFLDGAGGELGGLAYADTLGERLILRTADTDQAWLDQDGRLGIGTSLPTAPLEVTGGTDVTLGGGGEMVVGTVTGRNLAFDGNEIQGRNNGAAAGLNLNADGGNVGTGGDLLVGGGITTQANVVIGGLADIGYEVVSDSCQNDCINSNSELSVFCPPGKVILGGGCDFLAGPSDQPAWKSFPIGETGWSCRNFCSPCTNLLITAYAICAKVQ